MSDITNDHVGCIVFLAGIKLFMLCKIDAIFFLNEYKITSKHDLIGCSKVFILPIESSKLSADFVHAST